MGIGSMYDHKISHDQPFGYSASDAFLHLNRVQGAFEDQSFLFTDAAMLTGEEGIVGFYSPISVVSPGHISFLSGLNIHDTMLLNGGFIMALLTLISFFIIRKLNLHIALLALPLTLLLTSGKHFIPIPFGIMGLVYGYLFLLLFCWSLFFFFKEGLGFVFIALSSAFIIMSHGSQIIFAGLITFIYLAFYSLKNKLWEDKRWIPPLKKGLIIALVTVVLAGYSFLLQYVSCSGGGMMIYTPGKAVFSIGNIPNVFLFEYGWIILSLVVIGVLTLLLTKKFEYASVFLGLFILGLFNFIGIPYPAFQQRFYWPIALSLFFGAGIYIIIKTLKLKKYSVFASIALIIIFSLAYTGQNPNPGMMDKFHWEAIQKVKLDTPEESEILVPALPPYTQAAMKYQFKRRAFVNNEFVKMNEWATDMIGGKSIKNQTIVTKIGSEGTCGFPVLSGFLKITQREVPDAYTHTRDFCSFDYYLFDKVLYREDQRTTVLALHAIKDRMLSKSWIDVFFENDLVIIIQNKDKDKECINDEN